MAGYGSLPFDKQIEYFRSKVNVPTRAWTDVYASAHDQGFMIAGAMKDSLLSDLRSAVDGVVADGMSFEDFKKNFRSIATKHGWDYNGGENWRAQVIYETNLNQSYNAGREAQMANPALRRTRPYGMYKHYHSEHERPTHAAQDGAVHPLDDPWWEVWSPQNGWGCKCKKFAIGDRDVQRLGLKVTPGSAIEYHDVQIGQRSGNPRTVRVPKGIDPGFEYRPGARPLAGLTPPEREATARDLVSGVVTGNRRVPIDPLPRLRTFDSSRLLPSGETEESYVDAFLAEFGATREAPKVFKDAAGAPLPITIDLFIDRFGGGLKVKKRGRERYLRMLADTIKEPDEIVLVEQQIGNRTVVRRRYIARWIVDGQAKPGFAVFDFGADGWSGITTFTPENLAYLEEMREGFRIYRRK